MFLLFLLLCIIIIIIIIIGFHCNTRPAMFQLFQQVSITIVFFFFFTILRILVRGPNRKPLTTTSRDHRVSVKDKRFANDAIVMTIKRITVLNNVYVSQNNRHANVVKNI